jgi:hypothetical protein
MIYEKVDLSMQKYGISAQSQDWTFKFGRRSGFHDQTNEMEAD